jgi:hypothetical protein
VLTGEPVSGKPPSPAGAITAMLLAAGYTSQEMLVEKESDGE